MLLTPQGGPRCLAPTAHQIPVYRMVFSTFLCRAFTAQYLYTPRWSPHSSITLHGAPEGLCSWVATRRGLTKPVSSSPPFRTGLATLMASGSTPSIILSGHPLSVSLHFFSYDW